MPISIFKGRTEKIKSIGVECAIPHYCGHKTLSPFAQTNANRNPKTIGDNGHTQMTKSIGYAYQLPTFKQSVFVHSSSNFIYLYIYLFLLVGFSLALFDFNFFACIFTVWRIIYFCETLTCSNDKTICRIGRIFDCSCLDCINFLSNFVVTTNFNRISHFRSTWNNWAQIFSNANELLSVESHCIWKTKAFIEKKSICCTLIISLHSTI